MKYINTKATSAQALASEYKAPQVLYIKDVNKSVESGLGYTTDETLLLSQVGTGTTFDFHPKMDYLTFTCDGGGYFELTNEDNNAPNIQYSKNGGEWVNWDYSRVTTNDKDVFKFKGINPNGFSVSESKYSHFYIDGGVYVSGNVMSLIDGQRNGTKVIPSNWCFNYLLAFTSIYSAPLLPATTLTEGCYYAMFMECYDMQTVPELPATTLAEKCYSEMFTNCSSITTAPELPATTLATECYYNMFGYCTSLNYIKCSATNISADDCTTWWVNGVSATGTFVKAASMSSWPTGIDGIPSGWTVVDAE